LKAEYIPREAEEDVNVATESVLPTSI